MNHGKAISVFLLLLALILAGFGGGYQSIASASYVVLAMGFLGVMLASILEYFKSFLVLRGSVESTFEYMQSIPQITVTSSGLGDQQLLQKMIAGFTTGLTRTMGKVILVFYKVVDFGVKAIAGLCGLIYLIFPRVELLGLWIILSTIFLFVIFKFSSLLGFFRPRRESSKRILAGYGLLSLGGWVLTSISLWAFFRAFGAELNLVGFFFLTALFSMLSLTPYTFDGVGVIELAGMGVFHILAVPLAVSFISLVLWELAKLVGDFLVTILPEERVGADLSQYA